MPAPAAFIAPEFAVEAQPLPRVYTDWLYADPDGNPAYWQKPDLWPKIGMIRTRDQRYTVSVPGTADPPFSPRNTASFELRLAKGARCLVYSRYAAVLGSSAAAASQVRLPTQLWSKIWIRQRIQDGDLEIADTRLTNCFGIAAQPFKFPAPLMWQPRLHRNFLVSLPYFATETPVQVILSWKIAYLFLGR